ncbi:hypothetical protein PLICRDRAFT_610883 [Plicaturopsis crispa FD-325 SS-3]|nr:hypothetical protein PLICRDRAFT_610883 [Plicaturopsis crispa FD-325 SS-3]
MSSNLQQPDPHALPSLHSLGLDPHGQTAWHILLSAEKSALANQPSRRKYNSDLIGVRVLGWLLKDLWDHSQQLPFCLTAYEGLVGDINRCGVEDGERHREIFDVGISYRNALMSVYRPPPETTPAPFTHRSDPSFTQVRKQALREMDVVSETYPEATMKALIRDGYRCMLSGAFDLPSCRADADIADAARATSAGPPKFVLTQGAYLFSESAQDTGPKPPEYTGSAFAILRKFGLGDVATNLMSGQGVNDLSNVMTLSTYLHAEFDEFEIWLEEVPGQPHTYDLCAPPRSLVFNLIELQGGARRVTFAVSQEVIDAVSQDVVDAGEPTPPLPDPRLLAIRAVCARVAHASGAVEQMRQLLRDVEDSTVLASDGSTAEISAARLSFA